MGFKFLNKDDEDQPQIINVVVNNEPSEDNRLSINNRPAVFLNLNRPIETISEEERTHMLRQQRIHLIERMWEQGMILQTIISQDENGFTLRTEINF